MTDITLDVFTSEALELENGGIFSPTTSTLIIGDTQAALVDTQYREPDVLEVIRRIQASGKTLTTIFITHGHFDHYFGLEMLLGQFPDARAVATPSVAAYIAGNHSAERKFAVELCGSHGLDSTVLPEPLDSHTLQLDDSELRVIDLEQADIAPTSIVHIPSIGAVIAGDAIYNGVNPFLAASGPADWPKWVASVDRIADLNPKTVIAGHKVPERGDDAACIERDSRLPGAVHRILRHERRLAGTSPAYARALSRPRQPVGVGDVGCHRIQTKEAPGRLASTRTIGRMHYRGNCFGPSVAGNRRSGLDSIV